MITFTLHAIIGALLWEASDLMGWGEFSWNNVGVSVIVSQMLYRLMDW